MEWCDDMQPTITPSPYWFARFPRRIVAVGSAVLGAKGGLFALGLVALRSATLDYSLKGPTSPTYVRGILILLLAALFLLIYDPERPQLPPKPCQGQTQDLRRARKPVAYSSGIPQPRR